MDLRRNGLGLSIVEGGFAMLSGTFTTGVFLTGFALLLGADQAVLGLVAGTIAGAQLAQLATPLLLARGASAKALTVWGASLSRYLWVAIAALPFAPLATEPRLWLFLVLATASSALGQLAGTSWSDWMADMVPAHERGRYFGLRNGICAAIGLLLTAAGTWWLDASGQTREAFAAVFGAVGLGALICHALLQRQPPPPDRAAERPQGLAPLLAPLAVPRVRRLMALVWGWTFVVGLTVPFLVAYVLQDLHGGYRALGMHAACMIALSVASQPFWGQVIDRIGAQRALAFAVTPVLLHPLYWLAMTPERIWPLALDGISAGLFWPGITLAGLALMMEAAPSGDRAGYLAVFSAGNGLATGVGALAGAAALALLGDLPLPAGWAPLQVLLAGSFLARAAITGALWRVPPLAARALTHVVPAAQGSEAGTASAGLGSS